jgi:hypothetical protein
MVKHPQYAHRMPSRNASHILQAASRLSMSCSSHWNSGSIGIACASSRSFSGLTRDSCSHWWHVRLSSGELRDGIYCMIRSSTTDMAGISNENMFCLSA